MKPRPPAPLAPKGGTRAQAPSKIKTCDWEWYSHSSFVISFSEGSELFPGEQGSLPEFFFNSKQLIVFCNPVRT